LPYPAAYNALSKTLANEYFNAIDLYGILLVQKSTATEKL